MKRQFLSLCAIGLLVMVASTPAEATHKAWLMKNSGGQCAIQVTGRNDFYTGVFENPNSWGVYVTCPITLAARGASFNPSVPERTWISAKEARIFFKQPNSGFTCQAKGQDVGDGVWVGRSNADSPGQGNQFIDLILNEHDWGGELEAHEQNYIEQLDYECRVGSGSAADPARLYGFEVAACQLLSNCNTMSTDSGNQEATVQGSGIECAPGTAAAATALQRSEAGFRNTSGSTQTAYCAITQPTDDSSEHSRSVKGLDLFFTGSTPTCRLESIRANGTQTNSANLTVDLFPTRLILPAVLTVGPEKSLAIKCDLPPNTTIEGWSARMTITRNSDGT
jgi:hypothetical protein